jgi:predicted membrane chloride channel (bestrophin family)
MKPKFAYVTAAIIVIWIAVMLIGINAPSLQITDPQGTDLTVPVGAICAPFFAAIATVFVAFWGYRDR